MSRSSLAENIRQMTEDKIAKLAKSILTSRSAALGRTVRSTIENRTETTDMNDTNSTTPQVSGISKLVSFGYNLIRGCPEGEFENGGIDDGIRTTNPIFKFTFNMEKNDSYLDSSLFQPDQVTYEPRSESDIVIESSDMIYGGGKSYRDAMSPGVSAAGKDNFCLISYSVHVATS